MEEKSYLCGLNNEKVCARARKRVYEKHENKSADDKNANHKSKNDVTNGAGHDVGHAVTSSISES